VTLALVDHLGAPLQPVSNGHAGVTRAKPKLAISDTRFIAGRATIDTLNKLPLGGPRLAYLSPPLDQQSTWRAQNYDERAFDKLTTKQLIEALIELSPEASSALWTYLRLCNPGFEAVCYRVGTDTPYPQAQRTHNQFLARVRERHGSLDAPLNRLFIGAWLRGAFFSELVMDENGQQAVDFATPDPATVRFRERTNAGSGLAWELGQLQDGRFVSLDRPTVRYIPIDPVPGSPWGRPLVSPAIFSSLFLLSLFHDIKRVVQQQGYPRIDISVDLDKLREMFEEADTPDDLTFKTFVDAVVEQVQTIYRQLQPDDAYIHANFITVDRPIGTVDSNSLGALDSLITATVRMCARAAKIMPLLIGITDGVSEANANRQWEIQAAGVKALQHPAESMLGHLSGLAMQAEGILCDVRWRFAELRASEALRDEQTKQLRFLNTAVALAMGWIDQTEAAQTAVGHKPFLAKPLAWPQGISPLSAGSGQGQNDNPGQDRQQKTIRDLVPLVEEQTARVQKSIRVGG
jgi:hypothetical protein